MKIRFDDSNIGREFKLRLVLLTMVVSLIAVLTMQVWLSSLMLRNQDAILDCTQSGGDCYQQQEELRKLTVSEIKALVILSNVCAATTPESEQNPTQMLDCINNHSLQLEGSQRDKSS